MAIRTQNRLVFSSVLATAGLMIACLALGDVPQPVLIIVPTNGTQFQISITNAVASTNYEIYRRPLLTNTNLSWTLHIVGDVGQSNFLVDWQGENAGFFRAGIGSDWDLDGIPNSQDADPTDA